MLYRNYFAVNKLFLCTAAMTFIILGCSEMKTEWTRKFDVAGLGNYRINDMYSSKISTYVVGSYWKEDEDPQSIIAKYNEKGVLQWYKIYERPNLTTAEGKAILAVQVRKDILEARQNIYVLTQINDNAGIKGLILIKYDTLGNIEWEKTAQESSGEISGNLLWDYENNIYVAGWGKDSDNLINIFITKFRESGKRAWAIKYSNAELKFQDLRFSIMKPDQFLIGGVLENTGDFFFIRYDSSGHFKSLKKHEHPGQENTLADLKTDLDGNVYLTGTILRNENGKDFITFSYDKDNNPRWARTFDGAAHLDDIAKVLAIDESLNVYVTGSSEKEEGLSDIVIIKYDENGDELWKKPFRVRKHESAEPRMLSHSFLHYERKNVIHKFYVMGSIGDDVLIVKCNANGFYSWSGRYGIKGKVSRPTAFSKECMAVECKSEKGTEAVIVKYGRAEHFGVIRWD